VESFHAQVRLELLDRELFFNLREVNAATSNYAYEYNFQRRWCANKHEHVDPFWRSQLECRRANPAC
jgi:hypothetical protein